MRTRPVVSLLAILMLCAVAPAVAEEKIKTDIERAQELMQAGDTAGAIKILEPLVKADPDDAQAWLQLARAKRGAGDLDGALKASQKAATFEETSPTATYMTAAIYATQKKADEAFSWLDKASKKGAAGIVQITFDPSMTNLYGDSRIKKFIPEEKVFADPFVESSKVLQEWNGEASGDQFGWIARNVGDVDDDDIMDVTTSAPTSNDGGATSGKVYLYSGKSGKLLWERSGKAGARLGMGIEAAGDTNADGIPDVLAGAPGAGEAYVYSGKDGKTLHTFKGKQGEQFGAAVSDMGDLDGDGHDDVIVGIPGNSDAGQRAGKVIIYSGKTGDPIVTLKGEKAGLRFGAAVGGGTSDDHSFIVVGVPDAGEGKRGEVRVFQGKSAKKAFVIDSDDKGAELGGMFVSVVGDVNADKVPDIYGSDWANSAKGQGAGKIYVHSGSDGKRLFAIEGEAAGDGFGIGPADAGDVDGDGHDDLIIGAWRHSSAAPSGGKVYLFSGKDGSRRKTWTCQVPADTFGFDATGMGDVNGDGTVDMLLTSAWSAVKGPRSGRMFIVSGK